MVDPLQLTLDSGSLFAYLALPPIAIAALFLVAWDRDLGGEYFGFGKRTFLLLLVGGAIGWIANLPVFAYHGSVMAVNVGGALLPIAISLGVLAYRFFPGGARELASFVGAFAVATMAALLLLAYGGLHLQLLAIPLAFVVGALLVLLLRASTLPAPRPSPRLALVAFGLVAIGVWATYATTQVIILVGIVSNFPGYVAVPVAVGALSVGIRWPRRDAPALAYATSTLGVLVGADVLHQPTLFSGPTFLGAIGGAGLEDLVFLTGLFALTTALGLQELARWLWPRALPEATPPALGSTTLWGPWRGDGRFREAIAAYAAERFTEVPGRVLQTVGEELSRTRTALDLPSPPTRGPLEGLVVHPLFSADLENLKSLSDRGSLTLEDARRSLITGFLMQRGLLELLRQRFAEIGDRVKAYLFDLLLVFAPAFPLMLLALRLSGASNLGAGETSIAFNAVLYSFGAWPFILFALSEYLHGATPGKMLMRLRVVGLDGQRPSFIAVVARNVTKLVPLAILSEGFAVGLLFALYEPAGLALGIATVVGSILLSFIPAAISLLTIRATPRRQRPGDMLGGTMVWRETQPVTPMGSMPMARGTAPAPQGWSHRLR